MSTDPAPNLTKAVRTLELQELGVRLGEHEGALSISYPGGLTRYDNRFRAIEELNAADYNDVLVLARHHKGKADDAALRIDGEKFKSEQRLKREKAEKDLTDRRRADQDADRKKANAEKRRRISMDAGMLLALSTKVRFIVMDSAVTEEGQAAALKARNYISDAADKIQAIVASL